MLRQYSEAHKIAGRVTLINTDRDEKVAPKGSGRVPFRETATVLQLHQPAKTLSRA